MAVLLRDIIARRGLTCQAVPCVFSRGINAAGNALIRPPMVGALANGKAGLADFPRLRGKHIHARDGTSRVSAEYRRAEQPRAQSLQPELKPAKRSISTARNSLSYNTRRTPRRRALRRPAPADKPAGKAPRRPAAAHEKNPPRRDAEDLTGMRKAGIIIRNDTRQSAMAFFQAGMIDSGA